MARGRPPKRLVAEVDGVGIGPTVEIAQPQEPQEEVEASAETPTIARPSVAEQRSERPKRVPINGYRDILSVTGQDPNFHYGWIRDDLVPRFENASYEFVTHAVVVGDRKINAASQLGSQISIPGGNGRTLYLMRVPKEYYQEDMASYHAEVDAKEAAMFSELNSKEGGRYGEVQIKHGAKTR